MNQDQAKAFLSALSLAQSFVPPVVFAHVANSPVMGTLSAVAAGLLRLQPVPPDRPAADAGDGG